MAFDPTNMPRQKIAIIGGGISGLGATHFLAEDHQVTLYEAAPKLGGHARTIVAGKRGDQPVDTGFIVFNYANYPQLSALFEALDVPVTKSNMSFAASLNDGRLEYGLETLQSVFTQKRNLLSPRFLGMIRDILRFNATALDAAHDRTLSLGDFLDKLGTGDWFRDYYLLPLSGAIWSTPAHKVMDFPAHALIQFFENHALLSHKGQHQWHTVQGGSRAYVSRLETALRNRHVDLRPGTPVTAVRRDALGVEVKTAQDDWTRFDAVIFATHSDDTLRLLCDPSAAETRGLGAIRYQPNEVVLHADPAVMPKRRGCWSSWNYTEAPGARAEQIDLTYWMNKLQPIPRDDPMFVTLNSRRPIREELIYDQVTLRHPVYDLEALAAQKDMRALNGQNNTWFCGAWMKNGFHEDGLSSALDVAVRIRAEAAKALAAE